MTSALSFSLNLLGTGWGYFQSESISSPVSFLLHHRAPVQQTAPTVSSITGRSSVVQEGHEHLKKQICVLQGVGFLTELHQWFTSCYAGVCKGKDVRLPYWQTQISASHQGMQVGRNCNWMVEMVSKKVFHYVFLPHPPAYSTKRGGSTYYSTPLLTWDEITPVGLKVCPLGKIKQQMWMYIY